MHDLHVVEGLLLLLLLGGLGEVEGGGGEGEVVGAEAVHHGDIHLLSQRVSG